MCMLGSYRIVPLNKNCRAEPCGNETKIRMHSAFQVAVSQTVSIAASCSLPIAASFYALDTSLIWGPAIPIALVVLAIAQMGVHLVFGNTTCLCALDGQRGTGRRICG
jgi:hypothetical protein